MAAPTSLDHVMFEQREYPRTLTLKTGKLTFKNMTSRIDCAILNISDSGACILVPDATEIPATFDLTVDPKGPSHACRVTWKTGSRIGVSFQEKASDGTGSG